MSVETISLVVTWARFHKVQWLWSIKVLYVGLGRYLLDLPCDSDVPTKTIILTPSQPVGLKPFWTSATSKQSCLLREMSWSQKPQFIWTGWRLFSYSHEQKDRELSFNKSGLNPLLHNVWQTGTNFVQYLFIFFFM